MEREAWMQEKEKLLSKCFREGIDLTYLSEEMGRYKLPYDQADERVPRSTYILISASENPRGVTIPRDINVDAWCSSPFLARRIRLKMPDASPTLWTAYEMNSERHRGLHTSGAADKPET